VAPVVLRSALLGQPNLRPRLQEDQLHDLLSEPSFLSVVQETSPARRRHRLFLTHSQVPEAFTSRFDPLGEILVRRAGRAEQEPGLRKFPVEDPAMTARGDSEGCVSCDEGRTDQTSEIKAIDVEPRALVPPANLPIRPGSSARGNASWAGFPGTGRRSSASHEHGHSAPDELQALGHQGVETLRDMRTPGPERGWVSAGLGQERDES
jgi:hypothetical protein